MAKVKGYEVTASGISAGTEQQCSLSIQNTLQEEEVKDATNPLSPPQEQTAAAWNIQQTVKLETAAAVKALIQAAVGTATTQVSMSAKGAVFSGDAWVGDLTIQAPNRGNITGQVTYQGTGALTKS